MGFALALGSGAGLAFLVEFLDTTIRGPKMLMAVLEGHPIAVIPFIDSSADQRRQRFRWVWILFAVLIRL